MSRREQTNRDHERNERRRTLIEILTPLPPGDRETRLTDTIDQWERDGMPVADYTSIEDEVRSHFEMPPLMR